MLEKIEIKKEVEPKELDSRLRNVKLRGFPNIRIYENADIKITKVDPSWIKPNLFIPQPSIYRKGFLDRVDAIRELFIREGIDIFKLRQGYDYTAIDSENGETDWTIIPPVVEIVTINFTNNGLDYSNLLDEEVRKVMDEEGYKLNPELRDLNFEEYKEPRVHSVPLVCDGSHRVHSALEKRLEQHLLFINSPKTGFPYYAAPKPYSTVHVLEERPEGGGSGKTHVLTEPGHKSLYRLFPTGGILSGAVRPEKGKSN